MPGGFPAAWGERVRKLGCEAALADDPTTVCDGARTTGTMGKGQIEEHGLCVRTPDGRALITGCDHPGIADMAERAVQLVKSPLHLVVGGFHMGGASSRQIQAVIDRFEKLGVATVAPCHCSGHGVRMSMQRAFGDRYLRCGVGTRFAFGASREGKGR